MLAPVTQRDYVFDECGRLVPPPGKAFMDLSYTIPMKAVQASPPPESELLSAGKTVRMTNQSLTVFCALGFVVRSDSSLPSFQIRWPSGRYINQVRTVLGPSVPFPMGDNTRMLDFDKPLYMAPGDDIAVEISAGFGGSVVMEVWGYVRWLVAPKDAIGGGVNHGCLVGYPLPPGSLRPSPVVEAIAAIEAEPRYRCDAVGQNLLAAETDLGNQCYEGEPRVFLSDPVTLGYGEGAYNQRIACPFIGRLKLVGVRVRAIWSDDWDENIGSDIQFAVRMPNGYGLMDSDMISSSAVGFAPVFPGVPVKNQDRVVFDVFNYCFDEWAADGSVTVQLEFHCREVK